MRVSGLLEGAVQACAGLLRALGTLESQARQINSWFKTESEILRGKIGTIDFPASFMFTEPYF